MRGKQKLHRMYAKHRAAKYAGKQKRFPEREKRTRLCAVILLFAGTTMLYCKELPLQGFPQAGVRRLEKLATEENQKAEEEVFSVRELLFHRGLIAAEGGRHDRGSHHLKPSPHKIGEKHSVTKIKIVGGSPRHNKGFAKM